jgi:Protein of unknown function (DUF1488)
MCNRITWIFSDSHDVTLVHATTPQRKACKPGLELCGFSQGGTDEDRGGLDGRQEGSPTMPLIRASEDCDPENLVGVRFPMVDASDRTKRVICLVTYAALHDRATFDGNGDDWMRAWLEHRGAIEALASYNYDHAMNTESGEVVIETEDLTPIG